MTCVTQVSGQVWWQRPGWLTPRLPPCTLTRLRGGGRLTGRCQRETEMPVLILLNNSFTTRSTPRYGWVSYFTLTPTSASHFSYTQCAGLTERVLLRFSPFLIKYWSYLVSTAAGNHGRRQAVFSGLFITWSGVSGKVRRQDWRTQPYWGKLLILLTKLSIFCVQSSDWLTFSCSVKLLVGVETVSSLEWAEWRQI